ncbi:HD domain-containing protein [Roseibium sp. RKSG952]|uniref:HD domain-containing protein n=1 Tax=Roseibium sp. RKSG952 TaxID=2529384 RepID=UPI0012BD2934|nr:HD domain-containing protein [Roseibium sp. RKSG952]MTH99168.1 HD domain-containing protein [Roseibium sp. RKSG952]
MNDRLPAQIAFLKQADKLKSVERANVLLDQSRSENSAEHSWHLTLWALVMEPLAEKDVSINRVIQMLLLHDLVEILVGDHPIHLETDWQAVALAENKAAEELFGVLPEDQAIAFLNLWREFEEDKTPDARFAKILDRCQPLFQVLCAGEPRPDHLDVVQSNLDGGRAAYLEYAFPYAYGHARQMYSGGTPTDTNPFAQRLPFLTEADQLKSVQRASRLLSGDRFENSAEHSWHIMLHAWVLAEYAEPTVKTDRVLKMLLLHDIVEIDAGDHPIHGQVDHAAQAAKEEAAASRLFGMLPADQYEEFLALWHEFEAAETPDARFAKAVDRIQTPIANLETGGGSWVDYDVTLAQIESRVGTSVHQGSPKLWAWLRPQLEDFFSNSKPAAS